MNSNTNSIKSFASSRQVELDISGGPSEDDLKLLRETDPFMYYSIPGARRAHVFGRTLGSYDMKALLYNNCQVSRGRRKSAPDLETFNNDMPMQSILKKPRRSSVSFAAHPSDSEPDLKTLNNVTSMQSIQEISQRSSISSEAHSGALLEDSFDVQHDSPTEELCTKLGSHDRNALLYNNFQVPHGRRKSAPDLLNNNIPMQSKKRPRRSFVSFAELPSDSEPDTKPLHTVASIQSIQKICRRSSISFEAHPEALLEDSFDVQYDTPKEEFCTKKVPSFIEVPYQCKP